MPDLFLHFNKATNMTYIILRIERIHPILALFQAKRVHSSVQREGGRTGGTSPLTTGHLHTHTHTHTHRLQAASLILATTSFSLSPKYQRNAKNGRKHLTRTVFVCARVYTTRTQAQHMPP